MDRATRKRKSVSADVLKTLLVTCKRRCCLCFGLDDDLAEKEGQVAHIDRDSANSHLSNLVYLCLRHHNLYDTEYRQSKRFTPGEIEHYKRLLHNALGTKAVRWKLKIEGILDNLDQATIDSIVESLNDAVDGVEITLKKVSSGSIVLDLESSEEAFQLIRRAFQAGRLNDVLGCIVLDVSKQIDVSTESLLDLAFELFENKKFDDALSCCRRAVESSPTSSAAWRALSNSLLQVHLIREMGQNSELLKESYEAICRAHELDPSDAEIWSHKGSVLLELGRTEDSLSCHSVATHIAPTNGKVWFNLGAALYNSELDDEAVEAFELAEKFGYPDATSALSTVLARQANRKN